MRTLHNNSRLGRLPQLEVSMDERIVSSPGDFRVFMESSIYRDFLKELDNRIEMLDVSLRDEELEHTGRHYDLFRGGIKNMNQMKTIFEDLLNNKENDLEEERHEEQI